MQWVLDMVSNLLSKRFTLNSRYLIHGLGYTLERAYGAGDLKKWYAVFTKPRMEETAKFYLARKQIKVFYPKLILPISARPGRNVVPLFPNYIFVRIDAASDQYYQVLWGRGIKRIVSFGSEPAVVDEQVIEFLRGCADDGEFIAATTKLGAGDAVEIVEGPFRGLKGIIQEPPDAKNRVKVLMEILNRPVSVEVPMGDINIDWVASTRAA